MADGAAVLPLRRTTEDAAVNDSTIITIVSVAGAVMIACIYDGELALLVVGALVGGTFAGVAQRIRGE